MRNQNFLDWKLLTIISGEISAHFTNPGTPFTSFKWCIYLQLVVYTPAPAVYQPFSFLVQTLFLLALIWFFVFLVVLLYQNDLPFFFLSGCLAAILLGFISLQSLVSQFHTTQLISNQLLNLIMVLKDQKGQLAYTYSRFIFITSSIPMWSLKNSYSKPWLCLKRLQDWKKSVFILILPIIFMAKHTLKCLCSRY